MNATAMEQRCVKRICDLTTDAEGQCNFPSCECEHELAIVRTVINELRPDLESMKGEVMNAMCAAFDWPQDAGNFPGQGGLTAACARAVGAYLNEASPALHPGYLEIDDGRRSREAGMG